MVKSHRDVRRNLEVAQRRQKDKFDRRVRHTTYKPGNLVLRYNPQLKAGAPKKFHQFWVGPFSVLEQVAEVTYRISNRKKSKRSSVVHFNNLRLYQGKPEESKRDATGSRASNETACDPTDNCPKEGVNDIPDDLSVDERLEQGGAENVRNELDLENDTTDEYVPETDTDDEEEPAVRHSRRVIRRPGRYGDWIMSIADNV